MSISAFDDLFLMDNIAIAISLSILIFIISILNKAQNVIFYKFVEYRLYHMGRSILFSIVAAVILLYFFIPFTGLQRYEKGFLLLLFFLLWASQEYFGGRVRKAVLSFVFFFSITPFFTNPSSPLRQLTNKEESVLSTNILNKGPNLYFIGFDALVSGESYRTFFGGDVTPWKIDLDLMKWRYIDKATAAGDNSLDAFSSILKGKTAPFKGSRSDVFGGKTKTFATATSKLNNYQFSFAFANNYFGTHSGEWVDDFYPPRINAVGICNITTYYFALFLCRPDFISFAKTNIGIRYTSLNEGDSFEHFIKIIQNQTNKKKSVNIAYFWTPGHTIPPYDYNNKIDYENFVESFKENSKKTIELMNRITSEIISHDPTAILIIFGDHGSMITDGMRPQNSNDELLISLDKLGVSMAVYPSNFCLERIKENYNIADLFYDVFSCLNLPVANK